MKTNRFNKVRLGSIDVRWKIDLKRHLGSSKVKNQFKKTAARYSRNQIKRESSSEAKEFF
jgi:predicted metal-dependent peptidase